jgi:uncharacterized membrane protein
VKIVGSADADLMGTNKLIMIFVQRIKLFGRLPLCNMHYERAPHLGHFCFPLCWRCSSILMGIIIGKLVHFDINIYYACLLQIPIIIDGYLQYKHVIVSTNIRRIVTGFLSGLSASTI